MFDPYRKWLGIPPKDQPPNHYRLLSLELYEEDLDVIEGAADRAMGFVRQYQSGEHAVLAAKILNEIANARICLLKPKSKSQYDAELKKQLGESSFIDDEAPSFTFDSEVEDLVKAAKPLPKRKKNSAKSSSINYLAIGGIGAAVLLVGVIVIAASAGSRTVATPEQIAPSTPEPNKSPQVSSTTAAESNVAPAGSTTTKSATVPIVESKSGEVASGATVNMIDAVDLSRDVIRGQWEKKETSLIGGTGSRIYLPTQLPDDYRLTFKIKRIEDNDTIGLGFIMAGRQGMFVIDAYDAKVCGLHLDHRGPADNISSQQKVLFQNGRASTVTMTVHTGHLHVRFDGKTVLDWWGAPERLLDANNFPPNRGTVYIGIARATYEIESAEMTPLEPEPEAPREEKLETPRDLMASLDARRDAKRGQWFLSKGVLESPTTAHAQFHLPVAVPEEYSFSATVKLRDGSPTDSLLVFGLIAEKSYFTVAMSNKSGIGLERIDHARFNENETQMDGPFLEPGKPAKMVCTVSDRGIRVELDGRTLIYWTGDSRRLTVEDEWGPIDERKLLIGTSGSFDFSELELGPPAEPPALPTHPPIQVGTAVDLLELIDPQRDALHGTWEKSVSLRVSGNARPNRLVVPCEVPAEYKLTIKIAREPDGKTTNDRFVLKLPTVTSMAQVVLDGQSSTISGMPVDRLKIDHPKNESIAHLQAILPGEPQEFEVHVRRTGIRVMKGKTAIIDWSGNTSRLWQTQDWATPDGRIALVTNQGGFRIEKLEIEELEPSSFPEVPSLDSSGNLLGIIDPQRDSRKASWKLDSGALVSPNFPGSRLNIPVTPPEQYFVTADVERRQGHCQICLGLVVNGRACNVVIGGGEGGLVGLERLDDQPFSSKSNTTMQEFPEGLLPQGKRVRIRCFVLPNMIVATCDDKEVLRWQGDPHRLSLEHYYLPSNYSDSDASQLWIGDWDSEFVIRELTLRPLSADDAEQVVNHFPNGMKFAASESMPRDAVQPKSDVPEDGDLVLLINLRSGRCLSTKGDAIVQGPLPDEADSNERWRIVASNNGTFRIVNENSHHALTAYQGNKPQGKQLAQHKDSKKDDQRWLFIEVDDWYKIESRLMGLVVGVASPTREANSKIVQMAFKNNNDRLWRLQRLSSKSKKN